MELPLELELNIISFVPDQKMGLVCKAWQKEINGIRKNAVDTIGKWYLSKRSTNDYDIVASMVRYLVVKYPKEYFLEHPEILVVTLGLNPEILTVLPPQSHMLLPEKFRKLKSIILKVFKKILEEKK